MKITTRSLKRTAALAALMTIGVCLIGPSAEAGTANGSFIVQTTVTAPCTFTTNNLTFPNYTSGTGTAVNGSTNLAVTCPGATAAAPVPINFAFTPVGGTFQMSDGAAPVDNLNYDLCTTAACAVKYVSATAGPNVNVTVGTAQNVAIFGRIAASQAVPQGAYAQTVNIVMNY